MSTKPKAEPLSATDVAIIDGWRRADPTARKLILAILCGKIDIATSVSVLP